MDFELTPTQQEAFECGRVLAEKFGATYWNDRASSREFPFELWAELGRMGRLATLVPQAEGGLGQGLTEMALLTEGLAASGLPMLTFVTGPGLALPTIARHGTEHQRREVLPSLIAGEAIVAFAITEAAVGSNLFRLQTRAEPDGASFVLSGTKNYTSAADVASHVMVVARTPPPDGTEGRDGFTIFLVPADAPGFKREFTDTQIPVPERQCTLTFDGVVLGDEHVVGHPGEGLRALLPGLVAERVITAALSCGIGQYALDRAASYARDRVVFDTPIGAHQGVQHPLARAAVQLQSARLLIRHACWLADGGHRADAAANMASYAAGQAGFEACDASLQAHGGFGYTASANIYAAYQMARLLRSAPVSAESALNSVGELALGLPRSY